MRILFVHSELGVLAGGGENFSLCLIKQLVARGHRIRTVFTVGQNGKSPIPMPPGVEAWPLRGYWNRQWGQVTLSTISSLIRPFPGLESIWRRLQLWAAWRAARWHNNRFRRRVLRDLTDTWRDFDLAYVHADPRLAAALAVFLPTCLRLPGPVSLEYAVWLRKVPMVVANGDTLIKLRDTFAGQKEIYELPVGLDSDHFSPQGNNYRTQLGWEKGEVIVGYVGRFTVLKGVKLLAQAFAEISSRHPELRLLLVGEGEEMKSLNEIIKQKNLQRRVYFAGVQPYETMPAWYRSMDLAVMPSLYENFSNAVLESMGCALPLVASKIGGNRLVITEEVNGWLFEAGDHQSLTQTLVRSLSQRHVWPAMGRSSRSLVEGRYSWEKAAAVFEALTASYLEG